MISVINSTAISLQGAYSISPSQNRVQVAVPSSVALYANFKHVTGIATTDGTGASIDKLHVLNTLIEQLSNTKRTVQNRESSNIMNKNADQIDALIEKYAKEINTKINAQNTPYSSKGLIQPGLIVDLVG